MTSYEEKGKLKRCKNINWKINPKYIIYEQCSVEDPQEKRCGGSYNREEKEEHVRYEVSKVGEQRVSKRRRTEGL